MQVALLLTGSYREDPAINGGLCKLHLRGETPADDAGDPVVPVNVSSSLGGQVRRARRSSREAGSSVQPGFSLLACFALSASPHLCSFVALLKLPILLVEKLPEGSRGDTPGDSSKDILAGFWLFATGSSPQVETPLIALALFECRMRNRHPSIAVKTVGPAALRGGAAAGAELRLDLQTIMRCSATCSPGEIHLRSELSRLLLS